MGQLQPKEKAIEKPQTQIWKTCLRGALGGAGLYALAFFYFWLAGDFSYLGKESQAAADLVKAAYLSDYLAFNFKLLLLSVALGTSLGVASFFVGASFALGRGEKQSLTGMALSFALLTTLVLARSSLLRPQLFLEVYLAGGWPAKIHDWAITTLDPLVIDILLVAISGLMVIGIGRALGAKAILLVLLAFAVFSVGIYRGLPRSLPPAENGRTNVLLLVVDSLRTDRISGLGYPRQTTPHLDRLLVDSAVFANCYVPLPRTFPSIVSLLSGQLPFEHGIRHMFPREEEKPQGLPTLPRLLAREGYATAAVSDYAGEIFHDVDLGFQQVEAPSFNFPGIYRQRSLETQYLLLSFFNNALGRRLLPELELLPNNSDPEVVTDKALRLLRQMPEPFFMTVFYSGTHFPYTAIHPDYRVFADPGYKGPFRFATPFFLPPGHSLTSEDREQTAALYDGALRGVDRAANRLLAALAHKGYMENTLIIVTGDHGENLNEPGAGLGHGDHFYGGAQSYRVPLILHAKGLALAGKVIHDDVRNIDLFPSVVEFLKLDMPNPAKALSIWAATGWPRPVYSETGLWMDPANTDRFAEERLPYPDILGLAEVDRDHGDEIVIKRQYRNIVRTAKHRIYKEGPWLLMYLPTRTGVRYELYNEESDPALTRDVAAEHPRRVKELRKKLLALLSEEKGAEVRNDYVLYPEG